MSRFFTKKSVVLILTTIVLFGFFFFTNNTYALYGDSSKNININPSTWRGCPITGNAIPGTGPEATKANAQRDQNILICNAQKSGRTSLEANELAQMNSLDAIYNSAAIGADEANRLASRGPLAVMWDAGVEIVKSGPIGIAGAVISGIVEFITIPIASLLVAIAGGILDFSVQYSIYGKGFVDMKPAITEVWGLIRDTINITFIFILLYAGIQQIISSSSKKNILVSVITAAVLINFSLFITRIAIDASNLVATSIYGQIEKGDTSANASRELLKGTSAGIGLDTIAIDLSGRIMDGLGLTTIYDLSGAGGNTTAASLTGVGGIINSFTRLVLYLITFWVFMMLAVLIVGRFIMLTILMATSPLGFLGDTVPFLASASASWKKSLLEQCLLAPVLMFFMLLTIKLSIVLKKIGAPAGSLMFFFNYFFVVYLLFESVKRVKALSGAMGGFADKIASAATGLGLAAATGGTALLARGTLGKAASSIASSRFGTHLEGLATSDNRLYRGIGKTLTGGINRTASSSFDMRNTTTFGSTIGQLKGLGLQADEKYQKATGVGGYSAMLERDKKDAAKEGEAVGKRAEAYQQKFVDQEITDKLREKRDTLEEEVANEKDYDKREAKRKELNEVKGEISKVSKEGGDILEKIKTGVDFSGAEKKIADVKKQAEEIAAKKKEIDERKVEIETAINEKAAKGILRKKEEIEADKEAIAKIEKELKETDKEAKALENKTEEADKEYAKLKEESDKLEEYKELMIKKGGKETKEEKVEIRDAKIKEVVDTKNRKADFARSIRSRRLTSFGRYSGSERDLNEISESAEGKYITKSDKEKNKERDAKSKEQKELAKEIAKANAAEAKENK